MPRIAVVGAGVVGLSTAVCLQERQRASHVTLIADKFGAATTSDGAAGIFRPTLAKTPGTDTDRLRKWLVASKNRLHELLTSEADAAGVTLISGYMYTDRKPEQLPLYAEFAYQFRELSSEELKNHPGPTHQYGVFYTTLLCECRRYLPYLTKKFLERGGEIREEKISSLTQLSGEFDVVINCAGFANRELTHDEKMVPVRGHLLRVHAPWLKHFYYHGDNCYIIPGIDNVIIGGTRQVSRDDVQPRSEDSHDVMERATRLLPALKSARVLSEWVGLRPTRAPLRLEPEVITCPDGSSLKVVHNYGHGGEGVSLAWGTAVEACEIAEQMLGIDGPQVIQSKI